MGGGVGWVVYKRRGMRRVEGRCVGQGGGGGGWGEGRGEVEDRGREERREGGRSGRGRGVWGGRCDRRGWWGRGEMRV